MLHKTFIACLILLIAVIPVSHAQDPSGRPKEEAPTKRGGTTTRRNQPPRVTPLTVILTVLTDPPESTVLLNGEERGASNAEGKFQIDKLPAGNYTVEVRKEGYNSLLRGFDAGYQTPTLVFKLEPKLDDFLKEFNTLVAAGKLNGPETPNALEVVKRLDAAFPNRPDITSLKGILAARLSDSIKPVLFRSVTDPRSITREEVARASQNAETANSLKETPRSRAETAYLKAMVMLGEAHAEGGTGPAVDATATAQSARAELEKSVAAEESFAPARFHLGALLLSAGDFSGAESNLTRAAQLEPRWAHAHSALGTALCAQGKHQEAIDAYRKALEFNSNLASAHAGLGLSRVARGDKAGLKDIERAMQLDSSAAVTHLHAGIKSSQSKNRADAARAEEELRKAVQANPLNNMFANAAVEQIIAELHKRKK
ncbi:MAG TPA: tetratricopeptide repeat protein [Blastocatellia bacterium]